jgi:DNA-directed RNA polymerase specialized sigma24 family protein
MSTTPDADALLARMAASGCEDAFVSSLLKGDPEAVRAANDVLDRTEGEAGHVVWDYYERMLRVAWRKLSGPAGLADGGNDAVHSAIASILARHGTTVQKLRTGGEGNALWLFLLRGTLRHCGKRIARWKKRHAVSLDQQGGEGPGRKIDVPGTAPPPDDAAAFSDFLSAILRLLTPRQRLILELRLSRMTFGEIAGQLRVSIATVNRELRHIREVTAAMLENDEEDEGRTS